MSSVSTTGAAIYRTGVAAGPNLGGGWAFLLWLKVDSYADANVWRHSLLSNTARFDVNTTAAGTINLEWYSSGGTLQDSETVSTGSSTAWLCVAASHTSAAGTIDIYWRLEGASSWNSATLTAADLTEGGTFGGGADSTQLYVICDGIAASIHVRTLKTWAASRSGAELLDESALLDTLDDATGIYSFLDLDSITGLTTDLSGASHDFSVFGDFSTDAGETPDAEVGSSVGGGEIVMPQARAMARGARKFPRRAPVPGIAQLGTGILVGVAQPGNAGSGEAALNSFAVSASGAVTFTGSGSAEAQPFAAESFGLRATTDSLAPPQPQTFGYPGLPARRPMPPRPVLGRGLLVPGTQAYSGSASIDVSPFAVSASGLVTFSGSGSAAASPFAADAAGLVTFTGAGSAAASAFACSGTGAESFAGSCSAAMQPFAADGTGISGDGISGSGSCAASAFAATGSGAESFSGSGIAAASSFACGGSGTETFTGSCSADLSSFACTGNGALGDSFFGSGSATASPFGASSSGTETFAGSGTAACSQFAASGAGAQTFSGSCSAALAPFACDGSGLHLLPITGTGGAALSSFGASGSGIFAAPVTGSGGAELAPFACTGAGSDNIPTGPFHVVGVVRIGRSFPATGVE